MIQSDNPSSMRRSKDCKETRKSTGFQNRHDVACSNILARCIASPFRAVVETWKAWCGSAQQRFSDEQRRVEARRLKFKSNGATSPSNKNKPTRHTTHFSETQPNCFHLFIFHLLHTLVTHINAILHKCVEGIVLLRLWLWWLRPSRRWSLSLLRLRCLLPRLWLRLLGPLLLLPPSRHGRRIG